MAKDIKNELPEIKGFSKRNLQFMLQFYKTYSENLKVKQAVSLLEKEILELTGKIPWGHNILMFQNLNNYDTIKWYINATEINAWSRSSLKKMLEREVHLMHGQTTSNFETTLAPIQSNLASQTLKDPYIFDFLTLEEPFNEKELELELIKHLEKFLIELGSGFAFVGRQYKIEVSNKDFYIDLLFYHLKLRCYVVIELKKGEFKPEYAGKLNFYCSAVDDILKHKDDSLTIGLILCESKNEIFAEYSLRDLSKPIGVSEFNLTKEIPKNLRKSLPTIKDIEKELKKK